MQILSIRFTNPEGDQVVAETDGGPLFAPWPLLTWHREAVDAWLAEGNEIQPYVAPPEPVPDASPLQLFDELDQTYGVDLEAAIESLDPKALQRFRLSNSIARNDPFISGGLQPMMGMTDEQVDALFRAAAAR
jgi:hypothetical protein